MAQWEKLQQLDNLHLQRVDELYSHEEFPMDVRHYLAPWIESQDWHKAAQDQSAASILFQSLLENLDTQHSRFVQEGECFLKQRNIRRFKQSFQKYQEQPWILAGIVWWFLSKEQEILQAAELAEQVQMLQVQQSPVDSDSQRNLQGRITELKRKVQDMEHNFKCLEEQQDEFDFKYKTRSMEGNVSKEESLQQTKILQYLLNRLDTSRKALLNEMSVLLDADEELITVLVRDELAEWQRRQQKACIGAPEDTSLNKLEGWFTMVADCLFHLRKFLRKIDELHGKVTYDHDPFKTQKPVLQRRVDSLLTALLKSSFVVETQPSMPQGKGPMVLRTNVQFSVKTRLLVKFTELNHAMKVTVSIDREAPQVKGYRRFNVLGNSSKFMNMTESASGGMVADFRHLTLKEQKAGGGGKGINELSLSVTEELHVINFETLFELHGLSVTLEASSLPVVIISNSSQQQNAWASVLWFNMLCSDPKNIAFLANSPVATWPQLADLLSWQFLSTTKRGLEDDQLNMIAQKLFGKQQSYDTCTISWARFSKEMVPGFNFTFWAWFDGILVLVKNYLENLWNDGCIMGFVGKGREKTLLKKKQMGTFLLRFSESIKDGGITFSWVEYSVDGTPNVRTVQPFTKGDLSQIPFSEIIRNFQILEAENVPVNPLKFLYPSVPKDEAFGKYYTVKNTAENPYIKYIKTKLVFVSKENTLEAKSPMSTLSDRDVTVPMNGLCTPHSEEAAASSDVLLHSDCLFSDMDDAADLLSPLCTVDLEQSLQEYMNDVSLVLSEDQAAALAPSDLACYSLPCSSSLF